MWLCYLSHREAKKKPIAKMGLNPYISHLPSISTLPYGRLLCSRRACPSYTLYGKYIVANGNDNVRLLWSAQLYLLRMILFLLACLVLDLLATFLTVFSNEFITCHISTGGTAFPICL